MPEAVCCPKCWTWDELGKRTSCKRCGTPLILADGRSVPEAAAQGSTAPLVPAFAGNAPALPMVRITRAGVDWVDIARFFTIGYGLLVMAGLIALSLFIPSVKVPVTDPNTGLTTIQTVSLGPAWAIVGIFVLAFFLLFAWLTKFLIARIIFLGIDGLWIIAALSRLGTGGDSGGLLPLAQLIIDLAYGAVLIMSFVSPRPGSRS